MSSTRDQLRAAVFAAKEVKKIPVEFFGATIELRQPVLSDIINAQTSEDREMIIIETLIKYAYVPGTDEKAFEEGDAASFKGMPFGADFIRVSKGLEELTEVNFLEKKASSDDAPTSS